MTKLQECIYRHIAEEQYSLLKMDKEYVEAQQVRDTIDQKLTAELTQEQKRLFDCYTEAENYLVSLQLRHIFLETLTITHDIYYNPCKLE